jgi:hypothetical protein
MTKTERQRVTVAVVGLGVLLGGGYLVFRALAGRLTTTGQRLSRTRVERPREYERRRSTLQRDG